MVPKRGPEVLLAASMRHAARESVWHKPAAIIGGGYFNAEELTAGANALEDLHTARAIIGILCDIAEKRDDSYVAKGEIENARAFLAHGGHGADQCTECRRYFNATARDKRPLCPECR